MGSKGGAQPFSNPAYFVPTDPFLVVLRASSRIEGDLASLTGYRYDEGTFFETDSALSSWVSIELPKPLHLTHYSLGYYVDGGEHIPRNWILQGSKDNTSWATLSSHKDDMSLDIPPHVKTFPIHYQADDLTYYTFFRVLQTGPTSSGTLFLVLSLIELYGVLRFPELE
mmetsp:Transcript_17044/g.22308  ORF Transcript_17044/g.22308 Transcript_17044/m.22308 type:complete len:169 (-) Transcript_17044:349-855(-)